MSVSDHDTHTETRVRVLEHSVTELRSHVDSGFKKMEYALAELGKVMARKATPIPFKEIAATVAVMLGIFAYVGQFLETQYNKNISVPTYRLEQLEKAVAKMKEGK